jgi:ATP-dependent helicase/DNAse subunit B
MKAFWEYEQQIQEAYATRPKHFEFSFGSSAGTPAEVDPASTSHPLQVDSYRFRGKVDRIEIAEDGSLLVVDYKTGSYPSIRDMWEGERLQLPLYLQAVYQILQKKYPNLKMSGGAFYSLKSANEIEKKIAFADQHFAPEGQKISASARFPNTVLGDSGKALSLEQFLDHVIQRAVSYIDRIREGEFPHTPDPKHCSSWDGSSCPYRAICKLNSFKQASINRETSGKL